MRSGLLLFGNVGIWAFNPRAKENCMSRLKLLLSAGTVGAATVFVNCGGKVGLTSIGAALKAA